MGMQQQIIFTPVVLRFGGNLCNGHVARAPLPVMFDVDRRYIRRAREPISLRIYILYIYNYPELLLFFMSDSYVSRTTDADIFRSCLYMDHGYFSMNHDITMDPTAACSWVLS